MRINFGPNKNRPKEIPNAPMAITQSGIDTASAKPPEAEACTIAASGPTALATSFAPWAKLSKAADTIKGMPKSFFSDLFRFSSPSACLRTTGIIATQMITPKPRPIIKAEEKSIFMIFLRPLSARYTENAPPMIPTKTGTQTRAAAILSSR